MTPQWTQDAVDGLRQLAEFVATTPRGKPRMRVREVLDAVAALRHTWDTYRVRRRVGGVELRRLTTEHGTVVVFSREEDPAEPDGVILVRWVAQGNRLLQEPPRQHVRPAAQTPRAQPPR